MKNSQKYPVILLDQDGVLADFFEACMQLTGNSLRHFRYPRPWTYDVVKWMNEMYEEPGQWTFEELWKVCNNSNLNWWGSLAPYDWAVSLHTELLSRVHDEHHLIVCTYPQPHSECYGQKINWIRHHLPKQNLNAVIMGKQKHLFAKPHHILIDDTDENVNKFRKHGGRAILFPQNWNTNHKQTEVRLSYVLTELDRMFAELKKELTV